MCTEVVTIKGTSTAVSSVPIVQCSLKALVYIHFRILAPLFWIYIQSVLCLQLSYWSLEFYVSTAPKSHRSMVKHIWEVSLIAQRFIDKYKATLLI